jgi:hypothetical protein
MATQSSPGLRREFSIDIASAVAFLPTVMFIRLFPSLPTFPLADLTSQISAAFDMTGSSKNACRSGLV